MPLSLATMLMAARRSTFSSCRAQQSGKLKENAFANTFKLIIKDNFNNFFCQWGGGGSNPQPPLPGYANG